MIRLNVLPSPVALATVFALAWGSAILAPAHAGDAEAGKAASATCVACHGPDGNSPVDQFPKIAGQVPGYIEAQLKAYKSGERENAIMLGIVGTLSEEDMANLDAYYAGQAATAGAVSEEEELVARIGEVIYRGGYAEYDIPPCMACHGPAGQGIPPHYPRLAGQWPAYTEAQLLAYKNGTRANEVMHPIAFPLSEGQIKALSLYVYGLSH